MWFTQSMAFILFAILLGLGVTYFAFQNTASVTFTLLGYSFTQVPLFVVAIVFLIAGLVIGLVMNAVTAASSFFQLRGRESVIQDKDRLIAELKNQLHNMQADYEDMKNRHTDEIERERENTAAAEDEAASYRPSPFTTFFSRLREGFH